MLWKRVDIQKDNDEPFAMNVKDSKIPKVFKAGDRILIKIGSIKKKE